MNLDYSLLSFWVAYVIIPSFLVLGNTIFSNNIASSFKGITCQKVIVICQKTFSIFSVTNDFFLIQRLLFVKLASARVVNPIESDKRYPWLACLITQERKKPYIHNPTGSRREFCTGSVISKRYHNIFVHGLELLKVKLSNCIYVI